MKDIKIQPVRTIQEQRPAERTAPKEGVASKAFEQTLETTIRNLSEVNSAMDTSRTTEAKAASIQDEIRASNEQFQKIMKAKQDLSMLFHNIHNADKS